MADDQADLFPPSTRARRGDPDTSFSAALEVAPKMNKTRRKVLTLFAQRGRMTLLDLEDVCEDHGSTYRTRCSELVEMGYLADSGEKKIQNGSTRVVWTITPSGLDAARALC